MKVSQSARTRNIYLLQSKRCLSLNLTKTLMSRTSGSCQLYRVKYIIYVQYCKKNTYITLSQYLIFYIFYSYKCTSMTFGTQYFYVALQQNYNYGRFKYCTSWSLVLRYCAMYHRNVFIFYLVRPSVSSLFTLYMDHVSHCLK